MTSQQTPFGVVDGAPVSLFSFTNRHGMTVRITNYGGIVTAIETPDRDGEMKDVALGFDSLEGYLGGHPYFGANVGRVGNRVNQARFTLDGVEYQLNANDGDHHLHGGNVGFDKKVWDAKMLQNGLLLTYTSPDGEENYPGTLQLSLTYVLTDANELVLEFEATTDKATPVNLTHHSYFNLNGHASGNVLDHEVQLFADSYTPVDETLIPTGEIAPVAGTALDFTSPHSIGERIARVPGGYDHNFVISEDQDALLRKAARVYAPESGRVMEVFTTEPGIQFYTGNFLDGTLTGKGGSVYEVNQGFCLEPQKFPDSPNQPNFPSCILRPEETYRHTIVYAFSAK